MHLQTGQEENFKNGNYSHEPYYLFFPPFLISLASFLTRGPGAGS